MSEQRIHALEQQVNHFGASATRIERKLDSIDETLKSLVRIEERQIATNARLVNVEEFQKEQADRLQAIEVALPENLDKRLVTIETKMPGLLESRRWIVGGVLASVGMLGVALAHTVLK